MYANRRANLRLRWLGLLLLTLGLLVARWVVYYDALPILFIAACFAVELVVVQILLRRLRDFTDPARARRWLFIIGQVQVLFELVLLAWAVYCTGGIISPLVPIFFVYIFADGMSSSVRPLIFHAVTATLLMIAVATATFYGFLPRLNILEFAESDFWRNPPFVQGALFIFIALMAVTLIVATTFSRRTAEREMQLEQSAGQLAARVEQVNLLRDTGQRLTALLDLNQVLDAVCASALRLVKATDVHIFMYDANAAQFSQGVGVWADGHRGTVVSAPRADGLTARVAQTKQPVIINNAAQDPLFQSLQARAWALKAIAGIPIIKSERVLAVMNVVFLEPHEFTTQEQESLLVLADQAAIAIDNAGLYLELQRKLRELSALNGVTQSAAQLTDVSTLLNDALDAILSAIPADAALIGIVNQAQGVVDLAAHRGLSSMAVHEFKLHPLKIGEGFGGEVVRTGQPLTVYDMAQDSRRVRINNADEYASLYAVPLRAYDNVIGVLQLVWEQPHRVTESESSLTNSIAPQLAIALYNSKLFYETGRRADELSALRSIGLAMTSTLNLSEQLRLLYENLNQLLRADTFFVGLYDEARDELRVEYVVEEGWFLRPIQVPLAQAGLSAWVVQNHKSLLLRDLQSEANVPRAPQHITRPARSWLGVPLLLQERVIGLLSAQSFQPNAFSLDDERFLSSVAQHVALALENARLFGDAERRTRELTVLNEISRTISASLDFDAVLERTGHALSDELGYRYVTIFQFDGEQLFCKASVGDNAAGTVWDTLRGIIGRVVRTGRAVFVTNVSQDPDYVVLHEDVVAEMCVPILREGRVLGVVNVEESRAGALKEDDLALLTLLSEQLAIAASNASLYREALGRERFATRLGQFGMTVTTTLELVPLLEILCREALTLFAVDTAAIFMRQESRAQMNAEILSQVASADGESAIVTTGRLEELICRAAAGFGHDVLAGHTAELEQVGSVLTRALRLARGFVVRDARAAGQLPQDLKQILDAASCMVVPIMKEREVIGVMLLSDRNHTQRFGEPDLARAAIVASQAGLAIANARLYSESQRRAKEQSSLYEIGLAVSSTLDLDEQLRIIYAQVTKHFALTGFDVALREGADALNFAMFIDRNKALEPFSKPLADAGFAGWIVENRAPLVIDDVRQQWDTLPVKPAEYGAPLETASYIGIPLMTKSEAIGVMALQRTPVEPFTPDEQRFLFALAQQVAFAVDNARLHRQAQRTANQQSVLYQASRRIAGALDLDALLEGIVDALSRDFGFRSVMVMLLDAATNQLIPAALSDDAEKFISRASRLPMGGGLMGLAAQIGQTQLSDHLLDSVDFIVATEGDARSAVAVPIRSGARVIGVLSAESADGSAFADDDVRMFEAIADQLAVAIENAKLFTSAQERLARINALQVIEVSILSTMNLNDRLDLILEHALKQMRADLGVVFMRDPQTRELYGVRQRGMRNLGALRELRIKPGDGAVGWVFANAQALYIPDVRQDVLWNSFSGTDKEEIITYLGVPLQVEGRPIGVLMVCTRQARVFTDEERNFFGTLASHAAVVIENSRLYDQTNTQLEQLRATQDRLIESERRAAVGELVAGLAHEINNPLTAIIGHSQLLQEVVPEGENADSWRGELDAIAVAAERIARIVQEFTRLSHMDSGHPDNVDLNELVRNAMQKFERRDDAQEISVRKTLPPEPVMVSANPQLVEQVLSQVLTNALEAMPHGGRLEIKVGRVDNAMAYCAIRDSGYGIPTSDLKRVFEPGYTTKVEAGVVRGIGLGLYTAERIVKSHGGAIWIESEEGKFTQVTFTLPRTRDGEASNAN